MTHSRKTENNESSIDCHQRGWKKNRMAEIKFCLLWLNNVCVPALNVGLSISFFGFRDGSITKIKKRKSADATVRALRHEGVFKPENWSWQSIFLCCCNYDRWLRRSPIQNISSYLHGDWDRMPPVEFTLKTPSGILQERLLWPFSHYTHTKIK